MQFTDERIEARRGVTMLLKKDRPHKKSQSRKAPLKVKADRVNSRGEYQLSRLSINGYAQPHRSHLGSGSSVGTVFPGPGEIDSILSVALQLAR